MRSTPLGSAHAEWGRQRSAVPVHARRARSWPYRELLLSQGGSLLDRTAFSSREDARPARGARARRRRTLGSMNQWSSQDVTANGITIHYYRTGNGDKPALVLSHGASDSGLCWTRLTRALEADYDVIMPDARGHGLSDAPATGYANE